jgi:hypothetical protein
MVLVLQVHKGNFSAYFLRLGAYLNRPTESYELIVEKKESGSRPALFLKNHQDLAS